MRELVYKISLNRNYALLGEVRVNILWSIMAAFITLLLSICTVEYFEYGTFWEFLVFVVYMLDVLLVCLIFVMTARVRKIVSNIQSIEKEL